MNSSEWYIAGLDNVPKIEIGPARSWRSPAPAPKLTRQDARRAALMGLIMLASVFVWLVILFVW